MTRATDAWSDNKYRQLTPEELDGIIPKDDMHLFRPTVSDRLAGYVLGAVMREEWSMAGRIRSIESLEEMDGFVEELERNSPIGGDVRSMINLRKIELKLAAKPVRK